MDDNYKIEYIKKIAVLNVYDSQIRDWRGGEEVSFIKAVLPATKAMEDNMIKLGYLKIDSRFGCYINASLYRKKYNYRTQFEMDIKNLYSKEIFFIAKDIFTNDPRFNFLIEYDKESYNIRLKKWIQDSVYKFVCTYNGKLVGFIILAPRNKTMLEVRLAAILQRYRMLGLGPELYIKALEFCNELGYKGLYGSIETINLSAVNLYSYLNGKFVDVKDTYLKKVK